MMRQMQVAREGGLVGVVQKSLIFHLPRRFTPSVLSPDEFRLTLNKLRLLYGNLTQKKELRITFYVELIMIE